jgi:hypothetical protein
MKSRFFLNLLCPLALAAAFATSAQATLVTAPPRCKAGRPVSSHFCDEHDNDSHRYDCRLLQ